MSQSTDPHAPDYVPPAPDSGPELPVPYLVKEPTYADPSAGKREPPPSLAGAADTLQRVPGKVGKWWGQNSDTLKYLVPWMAPTQYAADVAKKHLPQPEVEPEVQHGPTELESLRSAEQQTGTMAPSPHEEPIAPPRPKPSAGGGGYATPHGIDPLTRDFNERLAAMDDERRGRMSMASDIAGGYGNVADEQRSQGLAAMGEAHAHSEEQRARIAEIDQLNRDYADGHLDLAKVWADKNPIQMAGSILGTMFAGLGGGVEGARNYFNDMVDRSLSVQKFNIEQKGRAGQNAENLLSSLRKTSTDEQDANDKARAVLIGAAMTEVQRAGAAAKGPVEEAQVRELMADMKTARDIALQKAALARAAAQPSALGLEVSGDDLLQGQNGQQWLATDKSWADQARNNLQAIDRMRNAVRDGLGVLKERSASDLVPGSSLWSGNLQRGENAQAEILGTASKMEGARGVPAGISTMVQHMSPDFGSRFTLGTPGNIAQAEALLNRLDQVEAITLQNANAHRVEVSAGPGQGKKAGQLTYYARPAASVPRPAEQAPAAKYGSFQPGGQ